METDSATLRPVHTGARTAATDADGLLAPVDCLERLASITNFPGLRLLGLDAHGRALNWMSWQDATCLYARGAVAWTLGDPCLLIHGGINRASGTRSLMPLHPIIAARGHARLHAMDPTPALTNQALFARDHSLCLYCGRDFQRAALTRDHVQPVSKGGQDTWENVVSACLHCNSRKGNRTPQQASMPLLAVPYRPSWVEHLILSNRNILADQMAFLTAQLPKKRPRSTRPGLSRPDVTCIAR